MPTLDQFLQRLTQAGFSAKFARAALPDWWDLEAEQSPSAWLLLKLGLAQKLNLDPVALLDDNLPVEFLAAAPTKYKHLNATDATYRTLSAFGIGVARSLFSAIPPTDPVQPRTAIELRDAVLANDKAWVELGDLLATCWALGIPVAHLTTFPAGLKGMAAMSVRLGGRYAILVARESPYSAQYMFHLAHELGHIMLGHLAESTAIVDADRLTAEAQADVDEEERAADAFAQELLTGQPEFRVEARGPKGTARELVANAMTVGQELRIDPGHVVLCFAFTTKRWQLAAKALKLLPHRVESIAHSVNRYLWQQLDAGRGDVDNLHYLRAVVAP
jgi:hypothetical protein